MAHAVSGMTCWRKGYPAGFIALNGWCARMPWRRVRGGVACRRMRASVR